MKLVLLGRLTYSYIKYYLYVCYKNVFLKN